MFEIKVDDRGVAQVLRKLVKKAEDLSPVMSTIAGIMADAVEENFEKEGPGWSKLAASTVRQRARKGHWPGKMLQVSGQLAASISKKWDSRSARVGTNKAYGAIQHLGGKAGRGHRVTIPARPYLTLDGRALEAIKRAIKGWMVK